MCKIATRGSAVALLSAWIVAAATLSVAQDAAQPRSLDRPADTVQPIEQRSDSSAALFIGVNEFVEDTSLRSLRFAVNDAIGLAHVFCIELKLIPPANATLALAGKPDGETATKMLEELKATGVVVEAATKSKLFSLLLKATAAPTKPEDLLIVSISSHGFEDGGVPYAMPADGLKALLKDTGLNLVSVEEQLAKSKAGKRLLFLDACREKPLADARAGGPPMSEVFKKELAQAAGQAVLASCDVGQYSWECEQTKQGVFTQFVMEGLRGKAPADGQGLIRMSLLADYVAQQTKKWSQANVRQAQEPWFKGREDARQIPLAVDPKLAGKLKERLKKLRELALDEKLPMDLYEDAKALLSGAPDEERAKQRRDIYEKLAEGQTDPQTAVTAVRALRSESPRRPDLTPPSGAVPPADATPPANAAAGPSNAAAPPSNAAASPAEERPSKLAGAPSKGAPPADPAPNNKPEDAILGKWVLDPERTKRLMLEDLRNAGQIVTEDQVAAAVAAMGMNLNFSPSGQFAVEIRSPDVNTNGKGTWSYSVEDGEGEFEMTVTEIGGVANPMPQPLTVEVRDGVLLTESGDGTRLALKRPAR
jgi:uncharacterized caspase-like protein